MLYKIECFENIFNRIYSIKKNSQTVIYLLAVVLMVDTNIVYATDTYMNFLKFLHVLRGMISDDRARTKYKYMEYASMKICYFRVRHVRTYTICQALPSGQSMSLNMFLHV